MYAMVAMRTIVMEIKQIDVHFHEHLAASPFLKCNRGCEKCPEFGLLKLLRTGKTGTAAPKGRVPLKRKDTEKLLVQSVHSNVLMTF